MTYANFAENDVIVYDVNIIDVTFPGIGGGVDNVTESYVEYNTTENHNDFNASAYVILALGERRGKLSSVIPLTIVYVVIFVTGLIGNVFTCIVIARNTHMHTATNLYLFALALSDVLMLVIGLPPELYAIWEAYPWRFGEAFCIFKSFISEMTSYASVLTITAFTIERYVAICYPIKAQLLSRPSRALKVILLIWTLSCLTALPYPIHTRVFYYLSIPNSTIHINDTLICSIPIEWQAGMFVMFQISSLLFFVIPMTMISVMYVMIGRSLGATTLQASGPNNNRTSSSHSRRAIIKMLVAVVIAFFICWAPFHAQRLMTSWIPQKGWTPELVTIQSYLFYISGVLYFVSSTVNPILYNVMSRKYRNAFKRTVCRCCYTHEQLIEMAGKSMFLSDKSTNLTLYASTKRLSHDASSAMSIHSNGFHSRYASTVTLTGRGTVVCDISMSELNKPSTPKGGLQKTPSPLFNKNGTACKARQSPMDSGFLVKNALLTTPTRYRRNTSVAMETPFHNCFPDSRQSLSNSPSPSGRRKTMGTFL